MTCRDRHDELVLAAAEKLQVLVRQLMEPFTIDQVADTHKAWLDAEQELQGFRDWFRESKASRSDTYPEFAERRPADLHASPRNSMRS